MGFTIDEKKVISAIVEAKIKRECLVCSAGLSKEEHLGAHRFLTELQKTLAFISEVKKGVLILVIGGFFVFIGGALLTGLAIVFSSKIPKL